MAVSMMDSSKTTAFKVSAITFGGMRGSTRELGGAIK